MEQETITINPTTTHNATIILLHGRDSTAGDFASEFFESQASADRTLLQIYPGTKWVFPAAGTLASVRFGVHMSQWFDMWSTEDPHERGEVQREGLGSSVRRVLRIVDEEVAVAGKERVVLGGISQGAAVAVAALLRREESLAGFVGLCTWFPRLDSSLEWASASRSTPVFLGHSRDDEVIAVGYGEELRDRLVERGMNVTWKRYDEGGHWINEPAGIDDLVRFLDTVIR